MLPLLTVAVVPACWLLFVCRSDSGDTSVTPLRLQRAFGLTWWSTARSPKFISPALCCEYWFLFFFCNMYCLLTVWMGWGDPSRRALTPFFCNCAICVPRASKRNARMYCSFSLEFPSCVCFTIQYTTSNQYCKVDFVYTCAELGWFPALLLCLMASFAYPLF